jgi:hypothetical protein
MYGRRVPSRRSGRGGAGTAGWGAWPLGGGSAGPATTGRCPPHLGQVLLHDRAGNPPPIGYLNPLLVRPAAHRRRCHRCGRGARGNSTLPLRFGCGHGPTSTTGDRGRARWLLRGAARHDRAGHLGESLLGRSTTAARNGADTRQQTRSRFHGAHERPKAPGEYRRTRDRHLVLPSRPLLAGNNCRRQMLPDPFACAQPSRPEVPALLGAGHRVSTLVRSRTQRPKRRSP